MGIAKIKENAKAHNDKVKTLVNFVTSDGGSLDDAVEHLSKIGVKTRRGKPYTYQNLWRIMNSKATNNKKTIDIERQDGYAYVSQ